MGRYTDGRRLFLTDAAADGYPAGSQVPLIGGWRWELTGDGQGHLQSPDGKCHCRFDLKQGTLGFEPDGMPAQIPGLSAQLVQEMGERYVYDVVFTDAEREQYDAHVKDRDETRRMDSRIVYQSLKGVLQLEHKDGGWLVLADTDRVRERTGIEAPHVLSVSEGYRLFNRMCASLHANPLRDPAGYMALSGNVYEFLHQEYRNQYENILQGIDNQVIDSSGCAVEQVLANLPRTVRRDIQQHVPDGLNYEDLRFVEATGPRKDAARAFVKSRVAMTLTYEQKRSYEPATRERTRLKCLEAGKRLRDSLADVVQGPRMELA